MNETLVDLSGLRPVFAELELPTHGVDWWFATLLRDGMALAAAGGYESFSSLARVALEEIATSSGRRVGPDALNSLLEAFAELPLHDDVVPAVQHLVAWEARLVALTNGDAATSRQFFDRAGLGGVIDVHSVESVQLWKPRPEAYRFLVEQVGVEASRLIMVAAHPWDLQGAKMVGYLTAWVNRDRRNFPAVFFPPDVEGHTLDEMVTRLIEGVD